MDMTDSLLKSPKPADSPAHNSSNLNDSNSPVTPVAGTSGDSVSGGSLFVGKLAFDCRTRELEDLFGKYGRITRCDIKRGFAFVEFEDERDATDAIKYLDGTRFLGFNITVERTKGEKRTSTNPDGSKNRECFKCGRPGHYAKECRSGGGRGVDRYERRDRGDKYDRRDHRGVDRYDRNDRSYRRDRDYRRDTRSRSPQRNRSRSRSRSRSPRRSVSRSPARY